MKENSDNSKLIIIISIFLAVGIFLFDLSTPLGIAAAATINNEDFRIATVVNFENSNSAFVHFMDIGNGIYRVEVDVYDVFGGTDGIDPYQDYDDLVFLIGPRSNLESFLGFVL